MLSPIPPSQRAALLDIATHVQRAGGRALVVGGAVRDLLLGGVEVKDLDLEVYGLEPTALEKLIGERYPFDPCGVSFGVLKLHRLDIDIALPRRESKRGEGHRAFLVSSDPFLSIDEAASRRDFTINAIYLDPLTGEIVDPYHGRADLEAKILRHVSPKFVEDPLRVLRGMQFVARFGLTPAKETVEICRTMDLEGLASERLFEEWAKLLLKGVRIGEGLEFLRATGWVRHFPELAALIGCKQDPEWHPEGDVWEHTKQCLDQFAAHRVGDQTEDLVVGLAILCHDFGKPSTSAKDPVSGRIRSLGHDEAGVELARTFLRRLTNEEMILKEVPPLVQTHMQPYTLWRAKAKDAAIRRLALKVGRIDRLLRVARADGTLEEALRYLADIAERLRIAAEAPKPILQGRDLIALGLKPSRQFGVWLQKCFEAQLDGAFSTRADAIEYFKNLSGDWSDWRESDPRPQH